MLAVFAACGRGDGGSKDTGTFHPLAVGDIVPSYQTLTLAGDTVRIGPGGQLTLLNVWATWCTSCREEMEDLETIQHDFAGQGLHVLAVSVDNGDDTRVRRYVEAEHLTMPVAHDPQGVVQDAYHTVGVPESYLVDSTGRLIWHQLGGIRGHADAAHKAIEAALAAH